MTLENKNQIWNVLTKYDNTLVSLCDSLSNILQDKAESLDYKVVFGNYRKMEIEDTKIVDSIIGHKIMSEIN